MGIILPASQQYCTVKTGRSKLKWSEYYLLSPYHKQNVCFGAGGDNMCRKTRFFLLLLLIIAMSFISSCGDDEDNDNVLPLIPWQSYGSSSEGRYFQITERMATRYNSSAGPGDCSQAYDIFYFNRRPRENIPSLS